MGTVFFIIGLLWSTVAYAQPYDSHMMGWRMYDYGWGGTIMMLILLLIVGVLIYSLVKKPSLFQTGGSADTPLNILKRRYAQGEITREEFEKMKKDIE